MSEVLTAAIAGDGEARRPHLRKAGMYWAAGAGCALASLANPYGYHLHKHIYAYLRDPYMLKYISEFQGTNLRSVPGIFLEIMLTLGVGAALWYGKRKQYGAVLMIAAWAHLSLMVVRNLPLYMIVAASIVAHPVVQWLRALSTAPVADWVRSVAANIEEIGAEIGPLEKPWRLHAVSAAVMVLLALAMNSPAAGKTLLVSYDPERYPEKALTLLSQPEQRIFTDDEWGDYLIYKLSQQGTKAA